MDVRVSAPQPPPRPLSGQQLFREDLYYRINVVTSHSRRCAKGQDSSLVIYFIRKYSHDFQKRVKGVSSAAYSIFMRHDWPGNVRELSNVIEYAFNVVDGDLIEMHHLPASFLHEKHSALQGNLGRALQECTQDAILQALKVCNGNKLSAAKLLGISRASLYRKRGKL